jgi:hypothetical protein
LWLAILAIFSKDYRGVGRCFDKGGLYGSVGKGSMISVCKIQPGYITIKKHRGAPAPGAPMVPTPMDYQPEGVLYLINAIIITAYEFKSTPMFEYNIMIF